MKTPLFTIILYGRFRKSLRIVSENPSGLLIQTKRHGIISGKHIEYIETYNYMRVLKRTGNHGGKSVDNGDNMSSFGV